MDMKLEMPSKPNSKQDVVTVSVRLAWEEPFLYKLKLDDSLSTIRQNLASKLGKMDKKLLFLGMDGISIIPFECEDEFYLKNIVKKEGEIYQIYLKVKVW